MRGAGLPVDFSAAELVLETVGVGRRFGHIYPARHSDPLGFGKKSSRFSDPRRRIEDNRFGVLYLGETLEVCFVEAVLRDGRNGAVGDYVMDYAEFIQRKHALIRVKSPLTLVDLRKSAPLRMGVPSDVVGASNHALSQRWSVAFHDHPVKPDGIVYPSRLNEHTNLAIYGRAISKLESIAEGPLRDAKGLAAVIRGLKVAIDPATMP